MQVPTAFPSIAENTFNSEVSVPPKCWCLLQNLLLNLSKNLPGVTAMEFLYYRVKNSSHSCEEIAKEKGNNILASLYRLVKNLVPILQWQHKMGDLQTNCTSNARIKVQIFVYRSGEVLKASRTARQLSHEGDKIVSLIYLLFSACISLSP